MKVRFFFNALVIMSLFLSLHACSIDRGNEVEDIREPSVAKIPPAKDIVREHPDIFKAEVPIFTSNEEVLEFLAHIETDNVENISSLCKMYSISNDGMRAYLRYRKLMEYIYGKDFNVSILEMDGESESAYKLSEQLLSLVSKEFSDIAKVIEIEKNVYMIEPSVSLDAKLLCNSDNLFICGDSVHYFIDDYEYAFQTEKFVDNYNPIMEAVAKSANINKESEETRDEDNEKPQYRRISQTVENQAGKNMYKMTCIFKTHYYHDLWNGQVLMHNYVWVKNYKKCGYCYILTKFDTQGYVTFNLDWKIGYETPKHFCDYFNFSIPINAKHAEWKYRYNPDILVYTESKCVTSDEYYINDLKIDVSNGRNLMQFFYSFY